ncbi:5'-nucleotidase C-terminal domain-containing protein [Bacillus sp. FJAT-52991]|uniref:5'-nucleotidase C-terminal domain-containing protein n=1 Tax=Bacillus kandeliae TaxID=3129297 RepID=A0ABZ2N6B5_9BACI
MGYLSKSHRKFVASAATATLVATAITPALAASFTDVSKNYKEAVDYLVSNKITDGMTDTKFGTSLSIKRVDAAVMLAKALKLDIENVEDAGFTDVPARAKGYVNALKKAGIVDGKTETKFAPDQNITRGEAALMLAEAYDLKGDDKKLPFTDVPSRYQDAVSALVKHGITSGKTATSFGTTDDIKRGEYAIFLYKLSKIEKDKEVIVNKPEVTTPSAGTAKVTVSFENAPENAEATIEVLHNGQTTATKKVKVVDGKATAEFTGLSAGTYTMKVTLNGVSQEVPFTIKDEDIVYPPNPNPTPDPNFTLSLMHTNDTHANLENAPKKMTAIKEVRAQKPNALLVDAGDAFSGTLYFNEFKGKADLELMNLMGYDVMTFGNHEFDLGSSPEGHQALADFIEGAKFPFVSSNVDFSKDDKLKGLFSDTISSKPEDGKIYNGIVKEVDGQKVGFFGLTTQDTKDISSPEKVEFEDYLAEAEKAVKAFEDMGVNKIVAVSHIGYDDNEAVDNDLTLATQVDGIDVIVGGHSHTKLSEPTVVNKDETGKAKDPTVIVQADQYNKFLGTLDVEFDKNGKVVGQAGQLIEIKDQKEDEEAKAVLAPYTAKIDELKNTPTGATAAKALENPRTGGDNTKPSVRKNETELGNLITDGMLAKAKEYNPKVVMALQNGGGIRTSIDQGPITVGEVINVLPFGNTLTTMEVTGAELKEAFETSVKTYPIENGGFLHVSGAKVKYDSSKPAGERVVSISYKKSDGTYEEIQDAETYTVATNAFTAKGGDGYDVFKKVYEEGRVTDLGLSDWENLRDHVTSLGTVDPKIEGRIVDVAKSGPVEVAPEDFSGTPDAPKVHEGSIIVDITNVSKLANAEIKGDLILIGTLNDTIDISNIKVQGNLDLSAVTGDTTSLLSNITVDGETIL